MGKSTNPYSCIWSNKHRYLSVLLYQELYFLIMIRGLIFKFSYCFMYQIVIIKTNILLWMNRVLPSKMPGDIL